MESRGRTTFAFGEFCLDPRERKLHKGEAPLHLTPKAFDTLLLLVTHAGSLVDKSTLVDKVWGGGIVDDGVLTRTISDIRKALGSAASEPYIVTIPKSGYRFVKPVTVSGDAIEPKPPVEPSFWISQRARFGMAALLAVGIAGLLIGRSFRTDQVVSVHSIGVLPLKTLAGERDEVLELGLTDTLIARLSQLPGLEVRSIETVRRYAGSGQDPVQVGKELKVDAVLEGAMHEVDGVRRINLRLISTRDGKAQWSHSFDQRGGGLLPLEDEISAATASALALAMTPSAGRGFALPLPARLTGDEEAFRLYLEGRYYLARRDLVGFDKAEARFEGALARDPNFAEAHAALAETWLVRYDAKGPGDRGSRIQRAREHATRATQLKPSLGSPYRVLAVAAENYDYDRKRTEEMYRKALELEPNEAATHQYYGEFLALTGRFEEAEREMQTAYRLDPVSLIVQTDRARVAYWARRWDLAGQRVDKVLETDATFFRALELRLVLSIVLHDFVAAHDTVTRMEKSGHGPNAAALAALAGAEGNTAEFNRYWALAQEPGNMKGIAPVYLTFSLAMGERRTEAIALIETIIREHSDAGIIGMEVEPLWDNLREEPEFQALLARMGATEPPEVRESARFSASRNRLAAVHGGVRRVP